MDAMKHFRVSPEMADALARAAEREGVSQSEIIRRALSGRLGVEDEPASAPFDPFERLAAAARGELQAQRDLANEGIRLALANEGNNPERCLCDALMFARLAAAHGELVDQGLVISIIALLVCVSGEGEYEDEIAEALARTALADAAGDEFAADKLREMIAGVPPHIAQLAQEYRARIGDEVKGVVA